MQYQTWGYQSSELWTSQSQGFHKDVSQQSVFKEIFVFWFQLHPVCEVYSAHSLVYVVNFSLVNWDQKRQLQFQQIEMRRNHFGFTKLRLEGIISVIVWQESRCTNRIGIGIHVQYIQWSCLITGQVCGQIAGSIFELNLITTPHLQPIRRVDRSHVCSSKYNGLLNIVSCNHHDCFT